MTFAVVDSPGCNPYTGQVAAFYSTTRDFDYVIARYCGRWEPLVITGIFRHMLVDFYSNSDTDISHTGFANAVFTSIGELFRINYSFMHDCLTLNPIQSVGLKQDSNVAS